MELSNSLRLWDSFCLQMTQKRMDFVIEKKQFLSHISYLHPYKNEMTLGQINHGEKLGY